MPDQIDLPAELRVPRLRYWGDRQPPKNRADMFSSRPASASADGQGSVATLRIYGPIDSWGGRFGVSAKDVAQALDDLPETVTEVRVRINSPGGEAWEGMAILNLLRAHPAKVVAVVDGLAASAASFVAAGADETVMSPGTQLMIHDASAFAFGPAQVMRKAGEFLDSVSNSIASIYAEATDGTVQDWRALMVEETWYTADEAVEAGLADDVRVVPDAGQTSTAGDEDEPEIVIESDVEDRFDLSIYNYAGRSHAPAPTAPHEPPSASASGSSTTSERGTAVAFSDEQLTDMRQQLGVPEDADEATILAAMTEALAERAEPTADTNAVPDGHVVIPEARLRDLEAGARDGAQAAATLREREREEFLNSVRDRYAPVNRDAWAAEYDRNPQGTREHFTNAPVIVNTVPAGDGNEAQASYDDKVFAELFGPDQKGA